MGGKRIDHKIAHSSLNATSLVSEYWSGEELSFRILNMLLTLSHDVIKVIQGQNGCQIKKRDFPIISSFLL